MSYLCFLRVVSDFEAAAEVVAGVVGSDGCCFAEDRAVGAGGAELKGELLRLAVGWAVQNSSNFQLNLLNLLAFVHKDYLDISILCCLKKEPAPACCYLIVLTIT